MYSLFWHTHLLFFKDCGTDYKLANGYVHYDGQEKTAGDQVSVSCMKGYTLEGSAFTTCLADGSWNRSTTCRLKGIHLQPRNKGSLFIQRNEHVKMNNLSCSLSCTWMTIIDYLFCASDSLSGHDSWEFHAKLLVARLYYCLLLACLCLTYHQQPKVIKR